MKLAWDNKADSATLTPGSEIATLPGTNTQKPHVSRKWHTAAGVKASHVILDMLASVSCSQLAVVGTNLTAAATYQLRASDLDPTAQADLLYDSGVVAGAVKTGYGAIYKGFNAVAARYWRLNLTDNSLPDNLQVGRVFLGPSWTHAKTLLYGWGITPVDPSPVEKSRGGQSYPDAQPKFRAGEFALDFLTEAEIYDNLFAMARANGVVKDVLAIPFENGAYISEQAIWGLVQPYEPLIHKLSQTFRHKFRIEERL
jgi:hypothetical protein